MYSIPTLTTERLILRPQTLQDAPDIQRFLGERDVAKTLAVVPHPYPDGAAEDWISKREEMAEKGNLQFAITNRCTGKLIGGIGFHDFNRESDYAEIGYWIAKPYWRKGYGTEAAKAVVKYGFEKMKLNRIYAKHFKQNPASGRIMQKIGMKHEGCQRQSFKKWGEYIDYECYAILKSEYYNE